ncbi:MAG: DUF1343 domain-containing protein, partial [Acidobacteriota bacterium]|nr:DUF1343 domain-containing protein [Acidobacteriota bacterium]
MFERYTEKARRVIFFARYEASQFGAPAIEPEHLLLGLMREDKTLTARFLQRAQASLEAIRKEVERRAPLREKISTSVELPLAPETKRVLAFAHEESDRLQHRHIGTEHLLLGLLREERSMAAEILYERGLRLQAVRDEVARATGGEVVENELGSVAAGWTTKLRSYGRRLLDIADEIENTRQGYKQRTETSSEGSLTTVTDDATPSSFHPSMPTRTGKQVVTGLQKLCSGRLSAIRGARVGLICNQASVDSLLRHAADVLQAQSEVKLTALFGPQHGIRGDVQDNMVESPHATDAATGLPVYSLYSETREPTERMLEDVDVLIFDMQDIGCRIYTFIYTLANCMRAARKYGKKVIVCDRPNPIGGLSVAGTVLETGYESFVGQFPIPTRHGMTVCEMAKMFNEYWGINCDLEMIEMDGWRREQWFDQTGLPWVMPSPNMPTLETATVFPGTVHIEGTQMTEGRGTTRPFELIGAPYIDSSAYARRLEAVGFPGVRFRAATFLPTFQKHSGVVCGGAQLHITDRESLEPVIVGIATIKYAYDMYRENFKWKSPPYEYVYDKNPFDVIAGGEKTRKQIEMDVSLEEINVSWQVPLAEFKEIRDKFLIY